jgi:putative nucleotidyltransferase with HDIG domain
MQFPAAIPSPEQCRGYYDEFAMFDNIRDHSILVARVAAAICEGLGERGSCATPLPNRELTVAGALLHDIAKSMCIEKGCHHAEVGRDICVDLGYPEVSEIVAEHVVLRNFRTEAYRRGFFRPKELVYYADKRVRHDRIVPLTGRLAYILERYGNNDPHKEKLIRHNFQLTLDFETFLFAHLSFLPHQIDSRAATPIFADELAR